jgi:hypothetical protein
MSERPVLNPIERVLAEMVRHSVEQDRAAAERRRTLRVVKLAKRSKAA